MITLTVNEVCLASGGELLSGSPGTSVACISTDTRDVLSGCIFVALKGDHFDGGDYVEEALLDGAAGVVAERPAAQRAVALLAVPDNGFGSNGSRPAIIAVEDSGKALGKIASLVARKSMAKVIAITGSTGKTSTKDMLFSLVKPQVDAVASRASYNNEVGVPLTLLSLQRETRIAVVEMGMQKPGEIRELVNIVAPEVAIITNVGPAHLEYAGSLENIARGKAEIAGDLPPHGGLVIPYGESLLDPYISDLVAEIVTFGFDDEADVHPVFHRHIEEGKLECRISCLGDEIDLRLNFAAHHHLLNFMAALGAYSLLGLPLQDVAAVAGEINLSRMRGEMIDLASGVTLLNDCYNANPLSMDSSLDYLVSVAMGRRTVAILGDMSELGQDSASYHLEVGRKVTELGIDCLVGVGEAARGYIDGAGMNGAVGRNFSCHHFADRGAAIESVPQLLEPGDVVLIKASRFMKMEELSNALISAANSMEGGGKKDAGASALLDS